MSSVDKQGYSACVQIVLEANGLSLDVSQVGEDSLILQHPCQLPATNARLVIIVDGVKKEYPVLLHNGASEKSRIVEFMDCPAIGEFRTVFYALN